jgi:hypothetical protein
MGRPLRAEEMRVVPVGQKRGHCCDEGRKGDQELSKVLTHGFLPPLLNGNMREAQLLGTMPIIASFSETIEGLDQTQAYCGSLN